MPAIQRQGAPGHNSPFSDGFAAGGFVFVSGQTPTQPDGSFLLGDFAAEVNLTLDNIEAVLSAAGADFSHVVKVNAWLANSTLFGQFNDVYRARFPAAPPARTTVVVDFAVPDIRVEIDAIAYLGG